MEEPINVQKDGSEESSDNQTNSSSASDKEQEKEHFCCSFCQERFLAIEELLSHIRIHTGGIDSEEDPDEIQVPQKMKRLSVRLPLLKPGEIAVASLECDLVGSNNAEDETSSNIASTSREEDTSNGDIERTDVTPGYQCPTCKRRFSRIIHQLNHKCDPTNVENQLDVINSGLKLYKCVICKEEFRNRQEKIDHKCQTSESHNPDEDFQSSDEDRDEDLSDSAKKEDSESDSKFEDDNAVVGDINIQNSPKVVVKVTTKKTFGKPRRRRGKIIHRCDVCHRSFSRSWNLKVHLKKMHSARSPVQPKIITTRKAAPLNPVRNTEKTKPAKSDAASFDFQFCPSYSEQHLVLRRVSSSNAYECPLCRKTMERREAILCHIRDHGGETPYHCSHCDVMCAHSAKILKHLSQTHGITQPNTPPQFEASKGIGQGTNWQPRKEPYRNFYKIVRSEKERMHKPKKVQDTGAFKCPICHKIFARFGVAQVHIRIHTGEAPFRCLLCEYQGKQQSLILAHLEHNHKDIISASKSHRDKEVSAELAMEVDDDVDEEAWEKSIDFEEGLVKDKKEESEEILQGDDSESSVSADDNQEQIEEPLERQGFDFRFRPTQDELDRVLFRSSLTKMYLCHVCPKEIKEKEIMLAHIRTHTGDKAYYCCHCDFGSAHDAAMRKHLFNVHGVKHAKRPDNNIQIIIRMTSKIPPSPPGMVSKSKSSELAKVSNKQPKAPVKRSSQQKPMQEKKPLQKPVQEKVVQQKIVKKQPVKKSSPKESKGPSYADFYVVNKSEKEEECKPQKNSSTGLYKCQFCKLESYSFKTVIIHTRTHTGEKPYKCRLCTFSAGQSSHVIRHLKNTHRVSLEDESESDDEDKEPENLAGETEEPQPEAAQPDEDQVSDKEIDSDPDANASDVDLDPVDYFAPPIPEELPVIPPNILLKDEDSLGDDTVEEGSQEGRDNDPDWETWMDRNTLSQEVMSAYKGKGKGKTSPKTAKVNYIFAPSESEKQLNLQRGKDKQFVCPTCGKRMRELEIIHAHIRTHTGDKPYSCCHCNFISAHIASIRKHITKVHHVKRPIAGSDHRTPIVPPSRIQAKQVTKKPITNLESKDLPEKFDGLEELGPDAEDRLYSKGTETYVNQYFKVLKRAKQTDKKYLPARDSITGRVQCRVCHGTFSSYGKAVVHIRSHTGEKPYQCLLCDYRSSQNPNMKRHIRNQHRDSLYGKGSSVIQQTKDLNDPISSDGQFTETPALDDNDHDLSGPSMVERTDFMSQAVVAERQSHQPGRPDYLYEPTERMRNYVPKRSDTTGMFECTYCSSQFYGSKKIETHVLKHTGEKPYLCMYCDFKSAYSFVMYRHLLKRHQIEIPKHPGGASDDLVDGNAKSDPHDVENSNFIEAQESDSAYTTSKPTATEALPTPTATLTYPEGEFDFVFRPSEFELNQAIEIVAGSKLKCPHCKKLMANKKKMVTHIRTHTGEKPFQCVHCDFKTAYKFVMQTHMKGIHQIFEPRGDDDLIDAQTAPEAAAVNDTVDVSNTEGVAIKKELADAIKDGTGDNISASEGNKFNTMMVNMSAPEEDNSIDNGQRSNYSMQVVDQKPDCFFTSSDAEKSRKLYRPSPSGPCQCPFCNRWLQGLENMRAHIRGHTGEKPYQCCHCDQKSAHFAAIKRHIIKVHRIKRPVMPGDVPHAKPTQSSLKPKRPGLVVKFKHVSVVSNLKSTKTNSKSQLSKSKAPSKRAPAAFTARDRTLTQFYRNFYTVNKVEELKKYTPKKDPVTKLFHCNFCGKQFNYHTEAQVHTRTHTGEKPYQCLVCNYKGSQWTNIVRHITCVHKHIIEERQREAGIGNLPPVQSDDSQQDSTSSKTKTTISSQSVQKSSKESHTEGPLPTTGKPEADYMFKPSIQEKQRVIQPSVKTGLYSCLFCKKKVPNLGKIMTHIRTHTGEKPFICCHCNFKSAYKFVIRQHLNGRHSIKWPKQMESDSDNEQTGSTDLQNTTEDMHTTPTATSGDVKVTCMNQDFRFQPSERESSMKLTRQSKTGCFECPYCGRQFSSSETMKAHIRGHTGDKAYYCCHCSFASAHIKSIRNHIQKVHNITHPRRSEDASPAPPQKLVPATGIPKEIYLKYVGVNKSGTKKFPPKRNPRTGRFKCHFCVMESKQLYTVQIHTMRHTGERPYYCKLCEYKATRQWLVTQHLQTNHKHILAANEGLTLIPKETKKSPAVTTMKIPRPNEAARDGTVVCRSAKTGMYYCSACRKEFLTANQCKEHIKTHSKDKLYQCPYCEHQSAHGGAMRNHMKIQHGSDSDELKKWYTYAMGKIAMRHVFQKDQDGMYMCTYCNKKSGSLNSARKHLCVHTGEKPYSCKLCSFKAIHHISIKLHISGHHKQITTAFTHNDSKRLPFSAQTGQNSMEALNKLPADSIVDRDDDENEWEDEELAFKKLASEEEHRLGNMEEALKQYKATSPLAAVVSNQVSPKDADFLYIPSEVDRDLVLQRSRDSQMYECPICNKQMTNTRTMRAHIRLHKGEKAYHCCHCDYKSAHYSVLRKHVVQVHKIQRPRMAQDSEEQEMPWLQPEPVQDSREVLPTTIEDLHLDNPSKIPTNMNVDSDQGFLFDANEEEKLSWHELQGSGSCQCPQCGKQCSSPIRTLQHMRTHTGAKPYHCRYCSFRSAYDTSMRNHVKTMHEVGPPWAVPASQRSSMSEIKALQCAVEADQTSAKNKLRVSEIETVEQNSLPGSSDIKIKEEPQDISYENKSSGMGNETPEMAWTFNEEDQSATLVPQYMAPPIIENEDHSGLSTPHLESSENSDNQSLSGIEIEEQTPSMMQRYKMIKESSPVQSNLPGDFTYEPSTKEKERVVSRSSTTGMYKCPYCPQEITSVDKIKAHIRKHTGDRPYQCLHCKFTSAYRFVIRTHIKNLHKVLQPKQYKSGIETGICPTSSHSHLDKSSSLPSTAGLTEVYRPVQVDKKILLSKHFMTTSKVSWAEHFKYIPSETEKNLILNRCSSTGNYQCPKCDKIVSNIDMMRVHVRTHTGEKPYYCCHCEFQSAHYDSIHKHLILIHKIKHESDLKSPYEPVNVQDFEDETDSEQVSNSSSKSLATASPNVGSKGLDFVFQPSEYERNCILKQSGSTGLLQCPHCPKQHRLTDGMRAHIRTHTGDKPYVCCHCDYICENLSDIKLHLYIIHNVSKPIKPGCVMLKPPPVVKSSVKDGEEKFEMDRYRHLFDIVKETKKDRKGQTFKRNPLTRAYKCNYCPKESKHHYVIQIHMRMHTGEKPYLCRLCDYKGAQQSRIIFHLKGKHGDYLQAQGLDNNQDNSIEQTDHTGVAYQQQETHASYQEHFIPKLNVDFTMDRQKSEEVLLEELQKSRNYRCSVCGKCCANAVRTIEHMRQHTGAKPYACMHCSTRSAYDRAIRNHVLLQHGRNAKEKAKLYSFHCGKIEKSMVLQKDLVTDRFVCPFCHKTFRDVNLARSHIRMHTGETPYKCKLCHFRGANTRAILVHIERVHGNRCSHTSIASGVSLIGSQEEISRKRQRLSDENDVSESESSNNLLVVTDDDDSSVKIKENDYIIPEEKTIKSKQMSVCAKIDIDFTVDKVEMEKMYCIDHASGGYKCLYCNKILKSRHVSKIKNHLLLHNGIKPYKCLHCGFRSAHDGSIRSHVLSQHRKISRSYGKLYKFKVGKIERNLRLNQDTSGCYVCPYCSKRNKDLTMIKKHIRSHTGEKPYHCRKCSYMASLKWSVILHAQRQHKVKKSGSKTIRKQLLIAKAVVKDDEGQQLQTTTEVTDTKLSSADQVAGTLKDIKEIKIDNILPKGTAITGVAAIACCAKEQIIVESGNIKGTVNMLVVEDFRYDGMANIMASEITEKAAVTPESVVSSTVKEKIISMETDEESSSHPVSGITEQSAEPHKKNNETALSTDATSQSTDATSQFCIESDSNNEFTKTQSGVEINDSTTESTSMKSKTDIRNNKLDFEVSDDKKLASVDKANGTKLDSTVQVQINHCTEITVDGLINVAESTSESNIESQKVKDHLVTRDALLQDISEPSPIEKALNSNSEHGVIDAKTSEHLEIASEANASSTEHEQFVSDATVEKLPVRTDSVNAFENKVKECQIIADKVLSEEIKAKVASVGQVPSNETRAEIANVDQVSLDDMEANVAGIDTVSEEMNVTGSNVISESKNDGVTTAIMEIPSSDVVETEKDNQNDGEPEKDKITDGHREVASCNSQQTDKMQDECAAALQQQTTSLAPNSPDYLFKPSKEEKNFPKSNATGAFECPHCAKQFSDIVVMQTHVRKHTGETPYHCNYCSFKSARFPEIRQHLLHKHKVHRPKTVQPYESRKITAEKMAPSKACLIENYRSFFTYIPPKACNYKPIRNVVSGLFECPICGSTSRRSNGARVHYRIHTGEKPYHCLLCSYKGAQQSRVVTHIKYNHREALMSKEILVQPGASGQADCLQTDPSITNVVKQTDLKPVRDTDENACDDAIMKEDNNLVIDETGFVERGVKRKLRQAIAGTPHEPMWKNGYEYKPSVAENDLAIEQDIDGVFMCPICPHKHKLKNVVRNHIRKHTGEKPYYCCHCDFTTANFSSIRTHLIQAHKSLPHKPDVPAAIEQQDKKKVKIDVEPLTIEETPLADGYTFTRSLLEKSLRLQRTVRGKYQCPYCTYEYGALAIVMAHVRTHTGDKPFQCNYCPYSAADYSAMRKHLIKKHDKWQPKAKIWSGVNVNQSSDTLDKPPVMPQHPSVVKESGHSDRLHYVFKCGIAEKGLSFHKSDAGLYQCPYCPHQHKKKSVVRAHVRKHTGEKPYLCKHCTFKCANFSWMREHLMKRHDMKAGQLSKKSKVTENKKSKSLMPNSASPLPKTPKCDFLFAPSDTEKHVELSRTSSGSYVCVFCKKELRIINNMRAHIRGHIGDKPYYCTRCEFRSAHISALRRHLFTMHRIRNAKGQKSTQQVALAMTKPLRSPCRTQPEPIPVVQPLKSTVSSTISPIIKHNLTAPRPGERATPGNKGLQQQRSPSAYKTSPFSNQVKTAKYVYEETPSELALLNSLQASNTLQCPHCGHKFSSISRTMEHVRKHTGAKPFRCLVCNFKSAYEGCISRHVSLKHELSAQQLAQFFTFKIGNIEQSIDLQKNANTGHYQCPFCEKSWPESAKVKRHMCIHTGEKPYRCNLCGFGAVDKSSMVHHLEMSHKKQITDKGIHPVETKYNSHQSPPIQGRGNFTIQTTESTKLVLRRVPESQKTPESPKKSSPHRLSQEKSRPILKVPSPQNLSPTDSCGYNYLPTQSELRLLEKLNVEGKLKCQYCGKICHSAARTLEHIRMHTGEKPYACKHCHFKSAYEGVMKKHVMVRHGKGSGLSVLYSFVAGKILQSIEFEREESTGRYKCPFCEKTMTSLTGAKRHVCTHTGEKPYKCKLCSYCANERSTILWHIDRNHKNADEHVPGLNQQCHSKPQAPQHKVEQTKSDVTHALGLAPSVTSDVEANRSVVSINKRGHIDFSPTHQFKKIHLEPGDNHTVSQMFSFEPGKIERSLNLQRDPINGRYLCPFCEQTSRDLTNAKNHVRVHIGEKPFKCNLCEYASVQRSLVIVHVEKHHIVYPVGMYPSGEYHRHDITASRDVPSSLGRQKHAGAIQQVAFNYRQAPVSASTEQYTGPAQVDDMPLDLSKPLDLSNPGKKKQTAPSVEKERNIYPVLGSDVAMDLSAKVCVEVESQESSMDEEEEEALLEAEMIAEEELLMRNEEDMGEDEEELTADDEERLLEELEEGDEEDMLTEEELTDVNVKQLHIDEAVSDVNEELARKAGPPGIVPQKPVSLVKPLNSNKVIENRAGARSSMQSNKEMGQSITVRSVLRDDTYLHPGPRKSERNIWDMAFNWSSVNKSDGCDGTEKSEMPRVVESRDEHSEGIATVSCPIDTSRDNTDNDNGAGIPEDALTGSDANVYTPVKEKSEVSVLERLLQKDSVRRHGPTADSGVEIHVNTVGNTLIASDEHNVTMPTEACLQSTETIHEPSTVTSPRPSPSEDTHLELPSTSVWQAMQETTPTKLPTSASIALTCDNRDSDGLHSDEMSSPTSGSLPVITNVMSLNPSLWKSP